LEASFPSEERNILTIIKYNLNGTKKEQSSETPNEGQSNEEGNYIRLIAREERREEGKYEGVHRASVDKHGATKSKFDPYIAPTVSQLGRDQKSNFFKVSS